VRSRMNTQHGGKAASVSHTKQRRAIFAARHYLSFAPGSTLPLRCGGPGTPWN
jgi:Holliday junction resolvase-like predicted endonuclease